MSAAAVSLGLHLSAEEHPPGFLVETAVKAERAGFDFVTLRAARDARGGGRGHARAVEGRRRARAPHPPLHGRARAALEHYEQAPASVIEEQVAEGILCANDARQHLDAIAEYADAGFDHVVVQQCGSDQDRFISLYAEEVLLEVTAPTSRPPG